MRVVITGGAGFLGTCLAKEILARGALPIAAGDCEPVDELILFDNQAPQSDGTADARVRFVEGDISNRSTLMQLVDAPHTAVFHLASVVSSGAEQDFDLAMRVNFDGHRNLLEAIRSTGFCPRYVFASSLAVYGGDAGGNCVGDNTRHVPQTTYGMTKAIGELLVNDYTRKGFIDGRSARLGMVVVRPSQANRAASAFASGIVREPLKGIDYDVPVPLTTLVAIAGYRSIIDGLLDLHKLPGEQLGADRALNLPTVSVPLADMVDSLYRVAGTTGIGRIREQLDPSVMRIVAGWPNRMEAQRAQTLGISNAATLDSIIRSYMTDFAAPR
jgi:nucleoside-diphosphate-sugar epimerase